MQDVHGVTKSVPLNIFHIWHSKFIATLKISRAYFHEENYIITLHSNQEKNDVHIFSYLRNFHGVKSRTTSEQSWINTDGSDLNDLKCFLPLSIRLFICLI